MPKSNFSYVLTGQAARLLGSIRTAAIVRIPAVGRISVAIALVSVLVACPLPFFSDGDGTPSDSPQQDDDTGRSDQASNQALEPILTPGGRQFRAYLMVEIESPETGAVLRYTVDETDPTETSPEYAGPIFITNSTTVQARAFVDGKTPSEIVSAEYTLSLAPTRTSSARLTVRTDRLGYLPTQPVTVDVAVGDLGQSESLYLSLILITPDGDILHLGPDGPAGEPVLLTDSALGRPAVVTLSEAWEADSEDPVGVYQLIGVAARDAEFADPVAAHKATFVVAAKPTVVVTGPDIVRRDEANLPLTLYSVTSPYDDGGSDNSFGVMLNGWGAESRILMDSSDSPGGSQWVPISEIDWSGGALLTMVGLFDLPQTEPIEATLPIPAEMPVGDYFLSVNVGSVRADAAHGFSVVDGSESPELGPVTVEFPDAITIDPEHRAMLKVVNPATGIYEVVGRYDAPDPVTLELAPGGYMFFLDWERNGIFQPFERTAAVITENPTDVTFDLIHPHSSVETKYSPEVLQEAAKMKFAAWDDVRVVLEPSQTDFYDRAVSMDMVMFEANNPDGFAAASGDEFYDMIGEWLEALRSNRLAPKYRITQEEYDRRLNQKGRYAVVSDWISPGSGAERIDMDEDTLVSFRSRIVNRETCEVLISEEVEGLAYWEAFADMYARLRDTQANGSITGRITNELQLDPAPDYYDYSVTPRYHPVSPSSIQTELAFPDADRYTPGVPFPIRVRITEANGVPIANFDVEVRVAPSTGVAADGTEVSFAPEGGETAQGSVVTGFTNTEGWLDFTLHVPAEGEPVERSIKLFRAKNNCAGTLYEYQFNVASAPYVVSWSPETLSEGVEQDASITITFSEPMDRVSTENAIQSNPSESGTFTWSENDTRVQFSPNQQMAQATTYTWSVLTTARAADPPDEADAGDTGDGTGTALGREATMTFQTVDHVPQIQSVHPANGATDISTRPIVTVEFSEAMDQPSAAGAFSLAPAVAGTVGWLNDKTMTFVPDAEFEPHTSYTISVDPTTAVDLQDTGLTGTSVFAFTTGEGPEEIPPEPGDGGSLHWELTPANELQLTWQAASDNKTSSSALEYRVYTYNDQGWRHDYQADDFKTYLSTLDDVDERGTPVTDWTENLSDQVVIASEFFPPDLPESTLRAELDRANGWVHNMRYYIRYRYYTVVVRDQAGNRAAYAPRLAPTIKYGQPIERGDLYYYVYLTSRSSELRTWFHRQGLRWDDPYQIITSSGYDFSYYETWEYRESYDPATTTYTVEKTQVHVDENEEYPGHSIHSDSGVFATDSGATSFLNLWGSPENQPALKPDRNIDTFAGAYVRHQYSWSQYGSFPHPEHGSWVPCDDVTTDLTYTAEISETSVVEEASGERYVIYEGGQYDEELWTRTYELNGFGANSIFWRSGVAFPYIWVVYEDDLYLANGYYMSLSVLHPLFEWDKE